MIPNSRSLKHPVFGYFGPLDYCASSSTSAGASRQKQPEGRGRGRESHRRAGKGPGKTTGCPYKGPSATKQHFWATCIQNSRATLGFHSLRHRRINSINMHPHGRSTLGLYSLHCRSIRVQQLGLDPFGSRAVLFMCIYIYIHAYMHIHTMYRCL